MKNKKELLKIDNCCTNMETLLALHERAEKDLKNNTREIGQEEIITIIREFIRCKNDYNKMINKYGLTGKRVKNRRSGKIGIIINITETGQIAVLERIEPTVINTHDSFKTLEFVEEGE